MRESMVGWESRKMKEYLTESRKKDLSNIIKVAYHNYIKLFGEEPHGTPEQISALVELMKIENFLGGVANEAVCKFYGEGQK